jgi:hypothetical protein
MNLGWRGKAGFVAVLVLCAGCLPVPETDRVPGAPEDLQRCFAVFPSGPWECIHKIEVRIHEGASFTLLGVTKGDPASPKLHTVLLTPEGFILFEAEQLGDRVSVLKAVAPFDAPAFASGLMEDVHLLFLPPRGRPSKWGRRTDGALLCEWANPNGSRTEVVDSITRKISVRDRQGNLAKEAVLRPPFVQRLASEIDFQACKPAPYRLKMTLLPGGS